MKRVSPRAGTGIAGFVLVTLMGCRILILPVALAVGAVGLVGYTVYKCGEAVVTTVGNAGSAVAGGVKNTHKSMVISRGTLKVKVDHTVEEVYVVAEQVMIESKFTSRNGSYDSLKGKLTAMSGAEAVTITMKLLEKDRTAVTILVGKGNVKQAEYLHDEILLRLKAKDRSKEDE